jgi:hypothetical protein
MSMSLVGRSAAVIVPDAGAGKFISAGGRHLFCNRTSVPAEGRSKGRGAGLVPESGVGDHQVLGLFA